MDTIQEKLQKPRQIVITTHFKPDGDALGSSLALYHWLNDQGHNVNVVVPSDFPYFLDWLPGRERILIYTQDLENANKLVADAELIFCLDFNGLSRTNEMAPAIAAAKGIKVMIDHHLEPENFDDYRFWDSTAAATAQLVYHFIANEMDDANSITPEIATCLYTGIMTDTGSFRFRTTSADIHRIVADLIERGAENWKIHELIYNSNTERRLRFLGFCLANRLTVLPEYNTAYFAITKADLEQFGILTGDTEGLVNYALSIQGIRLAALIIERKDTIKMSFRSIGNFPCNEFSRNHFNGGGHLNAAGGHSDETMEKTIEKFNRILPLYQNLLTQ